LAYLHTANVYLMGVVPYFTFFPRNYRCRHSTM
jgi:hypothetical protein